MPNEIEMLTATAAVVFPSSNSSKSKGKGNKKANDGIKYKKQQERSPRMLIFKEYMTEEDAMGGLATGDLSKGFLRVNQRNFEQCFVDNPDGEEHGDLLILGAADRNRALHGDLVAVRVNPKEAWFLHENYCAKFNLGFNPSVLPAADLKNGGEKEYKLDNFRRVGALGGDISKLPEELFKKTAQVVAIIEKRASRKMVGYLKPMTGNPKFILFSPTDSRIPRLLLPNKSAPTGFYERPQDFDKYIYLAELIDWREDSRLPMGKLLDKLGLAGDIEAEHTGLLLVNGVDLRNYEDHPELTACLPLPENPGEWKIDEEELKRRQDFRDECVFTIDPLTARDLDDALHIKQIDQPDGSVCWEVGVHIADVSYFLTKGTDLDEWARERGTSVYLVHQVIPMLPRILCEELCSLNPGVDRLTFSVVWLMDDDARIIETKFCRSVIRSCAKLAYEHAQDIIDNPKKQFAISEMPPIHCARKIRHIKTAVRALNSIALKLKKKRFGDGALKLDLPKLRFDVEKSTTGIWKPRGIRLDERKDANFLVEEFMLLANMCVARHIYNHFKTSALLRRHPPPKRKELANLVSKCAKLGVQINSLSSKTLADSMRKYEHKEEFKYAIIPALNQMMMKCMHLAQYFCTGMTESPAEFRHYALSVDFYTHFTSPIRRYPDVIVHRLLATSLGYCPNPGYSTTAIDKIASRSNFTKTSAKICSELSGEIFFGALIRGTGGHFEAIAVVMAIFDGCFDVLLLKYAIIRRVYLKKQRTLSRIYYGKLEMNGPARLVLLLKGANEREQTEEVMKALDNGEVEEAEPIEEEGGDDVEDGGATGAVVLPEWLRQSAAEHKQTLGMLSICQVRLVPIKNSVKYEVYLVPTPDSRELTWHDAKEHLLGNFENEAVAAD